MSAKKVLTATGKLRHGYFVVGRVRGALKFLRRLSRADRQSIRYWTDGLLGSFTSADSFGLGQHSQDPKHLLQGQGVPQAHPAQGHPVQGWQGLVVRAG